MESENRRVSVIMPALNEEKNAAAAVNNVFCAFKDYGLKGEIVFINDGSSDGTLSLVKDIASKDNRYEIKLINHDKPKGVGASFWEGVENAGGEIVVMIPGDNENDPWEIFRYVSLLEHVDVVIPFVFNREVRPLYRNALSFLFRFIINTTFRVNFNYTNGTVLYRRSILPGLGFKSTGFFFQTEILIKVAKRGYLFAEVPYRLGLRPEGISKAVTFPAFIKVAKGYLMLVRDIYFGNDVKAARGKFSEDSQSAKRYSSCDTPNRARE